MGQGSSITGKHDTEVTSEQSLVDKHIIWIRGCTVRVFAPKGKRKFVVYRIDVQCGRFRWSIYKRFKEVVHLEKAFRRATNIPIPAKYRRPSKSIFTPRYSTKLIATRRKGLCPFLQFVADRPSAWVTCPTIWEFFEISAGSFDYSFGRKGKEGWMSKLPGGRHNLTAESLLPIWKKHWFMLRDCAIVWYDPHIQRDVPEVLVRDPNSSDHIQHAIANDLAKKHSSRDASSTSAKAFDLTQYANYLPRVPGVGCFLVDDAFSVFFNRSERIITLVNRQRELRLYCSDTREFVTWLVSLSQFYRIPVTPSVPSTTGYTVSKQVREATYPFMARGFFIASNNKPRISSNVFDSLPQIAQSQLPIGSRNSHQHTSLNVSEVADIDVHKTKRISPMKSSGHAHIPRQERILEPSDQEETPWKFKSNHPHGSFAPKRVTKNVAEFIGGSEYFAGVCAALLCAQREIYITDWWLDPRIALVRPNFDSQCNPSFISPLSNRRYIQQYPSLMSQSEQAFIPAITLFEVLRERANAGVKIYVLLFKEVARALPFNCSEAAKFLLWSIHPRNVQVIRHPNTFDVGARLWSHHEKLVVVDQRLAFIGGMDLAPGRYDGPSQTDSCNNSLQHITLMSHEVSSLGVQTTYTPSEIQPSDVQDNTSNQHRDGSPSNESRNKHQDQCDVHMESTNTHHSNELENTTNADRCNRSESIDSPKIERVDPNMYTSQSEVVCSMRQSQLTRSCVAWNFLAQEERDWYNPRTLEYAQKFAQKHDKILKPWFDQHATLYTVSLDVDSSRGAPTTFSQGQQNQLNKHPLFEKTITMLDPDLILLDRTRAYENIQRYDRRLLPHLPVYHPFLSHLAFKQLIDTSHTSPANSVQAVGDHVHSIRDLEGTMTCTFSLPDQMMPADENIWRARAILPRMLWHDCAVCVGDSAALDVAFHFIQRWNHHIIAKGLKSTHAALVPRSDVNEWWTALDSEIETDELTSEMQQYRRDHILSRCSRSFCDMLQNAMPGFSRVFGISVNYEAFVSREQALHATAPYLATSDEPLITCASQHTAGAANMTDQSQMRSNDLDVSDGTNQYNNVDTTNTTNQANLDDPGTNGTTNQANSDDPGTNGTTNQTNSDKPQDTANEFNETDGVPVQVLRSVGGWSLGTCCAETSVCDAMVEAINEAKHFIYIENQFFSSFVQAPADNERSGPGPSNSASSPHPTVHPFIQSDDTSSSTVDKTPNEYDSSSMGPGGMNTSENSDKSEKGTQLNGVHAQSCKHSDVENHETNETNDNITMDEYHNNGMQTESCILHAGHKDMTTPTHTISDTVHAATATATISNTRMNTDHDAKTTTSVNAKTDCDTITTTSISTNTNYPKKQSITSPVNTGSRGNQPMDTVDTPVDDSMCPTYSNISTPSDVTSAKIGSPQSAHINQEQNYTNIGTYPSNPIAQALLNRLRRAIREQQIFRCIIILPAFPEGDPEGDQNIRTLLFYQMQSLFVGPTSIIGTLRQEFPQVRLQNYILISSLLHHERIMMPSKIASALVKAKQPCVSVQSTQYNSMTGGIQETLVDVCDQIYVHSKLLIVDDTLAIIGSANINDRSLLGNRDSEVSIRLGWIDTATEKDNTNIPTRHLKSSKPSVVEWTTMAGQSWKACKVVHRLRMDLWRRHLGLGNLEQAANTSFSPLIMDPVSDIGYIHVLHTIMQNNSKWFNAKFPTFYRFTEDSSAKIDRLNRTCNTSSECTDTNNCSPQASSLPAASQTLYSNCQNNTDNSKRSKDEMIQENSIQTRRQLDALLQIFIESRQSNKFPCGSIVHYPIERWLSAQHDSIDNMSSLRDTSDSTRHSTRHHFYRKSLNKLRPAVISVQNFLNVLFH